MTQTLLTRPCLPSRFSLNAHFRSPEHSSATCVRRQDAQWQRENGLLGRRRHRSCLARPRKWSWSVRKLNSSSQRCIWGRRGGSKASQRSMLVLCPVCVVTELPPCGCMALLVERGPGCLSVVVLFVRFHCGAGGRGLSSGGGGGGRLIVSTE